MDTSSDYIRDDPRQSIITVLQRLDEAAAAEGLSVATIADQLDERAFGLLMLLLALPCLVPGLPGAQIIAIPIFLLAAQVVIGRREPWLPGWFLRLHVKKSWLSAIAGFAGKRLRWSEALARPRLHFLTTGVGERVAALVMALAAITVMLPITNTIPSIALTLMCVGLIQRDGAFMLAGIVVAIGWLMVVGGLIASLLLGAGFAVQLLQQHAP